MPFVQNLISQFKSGLKFIFDFLGIIVIFLSLLVITYLYILQPHQVSGQSMEPNFHSTEHILTDRLSYRLRNPERGDVVILMMPYNYDTDYIKRVIGLPGETATVIEGKVYINYKQLKEPYLRDITTIMPIGGFMREGVDIKIPDGHYLVMGDNRPHSSDGRFFGPIPKKLLIGRVVLRYWPPKQFGLVPKVNYTFEE